MKRVKEHDKSQHTESIVAAAFQEHLMKSLAIDDLRPRNVNPGRATRSKLLHKFISPVVDSGRGRLKSKEKPPNRCEFVIKEKSEPPTLAQKLGLVDGPAARMTEMDWSDAKRRSQIRADSQLPCVICHDHFGLSQQVILSCSHVFHRNCLEAFERFTGRKSCPLCRKEAYQKRVIYEGEMQHKHKCATRIQATWRGHVIYSWYRKLRLTIPPKDPILRKRFFEKKLSEITDRLIASCARNDVDKFLRDIDRNVANSRTVFTRYNNLFEKLSDTQWNDVLAKAVTRDDHQCPICLNRLYIHNASDHAFNREPDEDIASSNSSSSSSREFGAEEPPAHKPTVLLSCSHLFHRTCLETFEELALETSRQCPVCRDNYQKLVLTASISTGHRL